MATPTRRPAVNRPHPAQAAAAAAKAAAAAEVAPTEAPSSTFPTATTERATAPKPQGPPHGQPQADHDAAAPASGSIGAGEEPNDDTNSTNATPDTGSSAANSLDSRGATPRLVSGRVSFAGRATTVYFGSPEERDRVKAAFRARGGADGYGSETDWYRDLILLATESWEREYNQGQPFQLRRRARR